MKNVRVTAGKARQYVVLLFMVCLFCAAFQRPARALTYETEIYGDRNLLQTEEDSRSFRLNYRVWSGEAVSRAVEPSSVVLLLDCSSEMASLAETPRPEARLEANVPYPHKVDEKAVLYTLSGEEYVPVSLKNGVWETSGGAAVGTRKEGTDLFTADVYEKSGCGTRMERMQEAVRGFLQELSQAAPDSRAGLVFFGETVSAVDPVALDAEGTAKLMAEVSVAQIQNSGRRAYASALENAAAMAEKLESGRPKYLISIASGPCCGEDDEKTEGVAKSRIQLQKIRELGARTYSILLSGVPEPETEEFWQSMSSVPLESHYLLCPTGEARECLAQVRRSIGSAFTVSVVQNLDPRFELAEGEEERLKNGGAQVVQNQDGSWSVTWQADLPRQADSPWTAGISIQAKQDFLGGNDIPVDGEGTGLYKLGKRISAFPDAAANVPVRLSLNRAESELFLGEKVKSSVNGVPVEEAMLPNRNPNWFGKGQTGTLSYFWETADGSPVGSAEQLAALRPTQDTTYRFRVVYRPNSRGLSSTGAPVEELEASAWYRVKVVPGTLRIKAVAQEGVLKRDSTLVFRLEKEDGEVFYHTVSAEADPQSGTLSLEAEITGLPFGTYTVVPEGAPGLSCAEDIQTFRLGVWDRDDTVSTGRNAAEARFTVKRMVTVSSGLNGAVLAAKLADSVQGRAGGQP